MHRHHLLRSKQASGQAAMHAQIQAGKSCHEAIEKPYDIALAEAESAAAHHRSHEETEYFSVVFNEQTENN